jgi:hypothetical protein
VAGLTLRGPLRFKRVELLLDLCDEFSGRDGRHPASVEKSEKEAVRVTDARVGDTTVQETVQSQGVREGKRSAGPRGRGLEERPHNRLAHDLELFNHVPCRQTSLGTKGPVQLIRVSKSRNRWRIRSISWSMLTR